MTKGKETKTLLQAERKLKSLRKLMDEFIEDSQEELAKKNHRDADSILQMAILVKKEMDGICWCFSLNVKKYLPPLK